MYTYFTKMIKHFFPPSLCLEEIKMIQIYVKITCQAMSGPIPVSYCSNGNSEDIIKTKIMYSRYVIKQTLTFKRVFLREVH